MNSYKPYSYLYKKVSRPEQLKSRFVVKVPAYKKLTLRSGDPYTNGNETYIRYDVSDDPGQTRERQEEYENIFSWDGNPHYVIVEIVSDTGNTLGKARLSSEYSDDY